ncbi:MAG: spermidine synthase [bacterium]
MLPQFEELGYQKTPLGELSLRRRRHPTLHREVYEVKLGEEYLMSSLYTDSERALGEKGVEAVLRGRRAGPEASLESLCEHIPRRDPDTGSGGLDIVVGGLGLGYTAEAVLQFAEVGSLLVVELFEAVIDWHRQGIVPVGRTVSADSRCRLVQEDFFACARSSEGFDPDSPGRTFDAVLVDIDHTPDTLLDPGNATLYTPSGLLGVSGHLRPGGVFGVWSDDPPHEPFRRRLADAFGSAAACPVTFDVFDQKRTYTQCVYLARKA